MHLYLYPATTSSVVYGAHVVPPVTENVTKIVSPEMCRQKSRAPKFPILEISRPWKRERNKGLK